MICLSAMSSRDRVLAAVKREDVDYVPCAPFMDPLLWPERVGKKWEWPFGPSIPETLDYMVGTLGVDQIVTIGGASYAEPDVSAETWLEKDILHMRYSTPSGALQAAVRIDGDWPHGFNIPLFSDYLPAYYVEPWLKTQADVECLGHILLPPRTKQQIEEFRFRFRADKERATRYHLATCFYYGMGLTGGLHMFGPHGLCLLAVEQPQLIEAYLELEHQCTLKNYEIALDLGVDFVRRNGFYETCDYYSPRMLDRFLGRRLQEEIELVHQAGKPISYTALSGLTPMLDYLARLEFDCLMCPDVFLKNEDARRMRKKLGDHMSFWTGPSDTIHMPNKCPDEVRKAVRYVFEVFGKRGLLITPCSSARAVLPWSWSNVLAMIDEWKKLR